MVTCFEKNESLVVAALFVKERGVPPTTARNIQESLCFVTLEHACLLAVRVLPRLLALSLNHLLL